MANVAPDIRYNLVYDGTEQKLIIDGIVNGGHLEYCIFEDVPPADFKKYSKDISTSVNAGTYRIAYIAVADEDRYVSDNIIRTLTSCISKAYNELLAEPKTHDFVYDNKYRIHSQE